MQNHTICSLSLGIIRCNHGDEHCSGLLCWEQRNRRDGSLARTQRLANFYQPLLVPPVSQLIVSNDLEVQGATAIATALTQNQKLLELRLSIVGLLTLGKRHEPYSGCGGQGAGSRTQAKSHIVCSESWYSPGISTITVVNCHFGGEGTKALAEALANNVALRELFIGIIDPAHTW